LHRCEPPGAHGSAAVVDGKRRLVLERAGQEGRARYGSARRSRGAFGGLLLDTGRGHQAPRIRSHAGRRQGGSRGCRIRRAGAAGASGAAGLVAGGEVRGLRPAARDVRLRVLSLLSPFTTVTMTPGFDTVAAWTDFTIGSNAAYQTDWSTGAVPRAARHALQPSDRRRSAIALRSTASWRCAAHRR